jgi:hypothetical protein
MIRIYWALVVSSVADPDPLVRDTDPDPYKNVVDSKHWDLNWFYLSSIISVELSVADPDPGSGIGYLFDPGIRDGRKSASGSGIRDEQPGSYFLELRNLFFLLFGG